MPWGSLRQKSFWRRKSSDGLAGKSRSNIANPFDGRELDAQGPAQNFGALESNEDGSPRQRQGQSMETVRPSSSTLPSQLWNECNLTANLVRDDLKLWFSGAPHFMLEKGRRRRVYPQAYYPWDNDLETGDLQDSRFLDHETFALSTLHAHLPVPDKMQPRSHSFGPLRREDAWKRPAFEVGVFEVPNMLAYQGYEPGTIGMRHFLELPISDWLRTEQVSHEGLANPTGSQANTPDYRNDAETCPVQGDHVSVVGKHARTRDLFQIIHGSTDDWKQIGVRDLTTNFLTDRLATITTWHDEVVQAGWLSTALDRQGSNLLYESLFTQFLHPMNVIYSDDDPQCLEMQIEALVLVLSTPGAWYDLSIPKWRFRMGQILWGSPDKAGAAAAHPGDDEKPCGHETKWLLIQLSLAIELVIRLDAALRLGLAQKSPSLHLSAQEVHRFNKVRNRKVDWDLIFARRFLDNVRVERKRTDSQGIISSESGPVDSGCKILPRQPKLQIDGLVQFARKIDWPRLEQIETALRSKLNRAHHSKEDTVTLYSNSVHVPARSDSGGIQSCSILGSFQSQGAEFPPRVRLQAADTKTFGSWVSRSWLTGLVLPGLATPDLLMSTLLENDVLALPSLGPIAYLSGGFVLEGRAWWSKACVVGRVLGASGTSTDCLGWINVPHIFPISNSSHQHIANGWMHVVADEAPPPRGQPRIREGERMARESSPLGGIVGKVARDDFIIPTEHHSHEPPLRGQSITFNSLLMTEAQPGNSVQNHVSKASVTFELASRGHITACISMDLRYNVHFISSQPCRIPRVDTADTRPGQIGDNDPFSSFCRQPTDPPFSSHPLRGDFKFVHKDLMVLQATTLTFPRHDDEQREIWILDATGKWDRQVFARAWCAQVGCHALVARVGRTCLSCCVREARAIDVGIVIRIGPFVKEMESPT